jgi:hypothetical protein
VSHPARRALRGGAFGGTLRSVRGPTIVVEEIAEGTSPERIAVAAVDAASCRAVSTLRSCDRVELVPAVHPQALGHASLERAPAMVVVAGDARLDGCARHLLGVRPSGVLTVAVVAVASRRARAELAPLAGVFDAVLPVVVPRKLEAEVSLARALAAVTAFATADCVSMPVDEVYPFFVGGGQLTWGAAEGTDVVAAAAVALAEARFGPTTRRGVRMLLHVETTLHDLMRDLQLASEVVHRTVGIDDYGPTASVSVGPRKRVSLVATTTRSRAVATA